MDLLLEGLDLLAVGLTEQATWGVIVRTLCQRSDPRATRRRPDQRNVPAEIARRRCRSQSVNELTCSTSVSRYSSASTGVSFAAFHISTLYFTPVSP